MTYPQQPGHSPDPAQPGVYHDPSQPGAHHDPSQAMGWQPMGGVITSWVSTALAVLATIAIVGFIVYIANADPSSTSGGFD